MSIKDEIKKVRDNVYEIPGSYDKTMRASGRFYIADEFFDELEEGAEGAEGALNTEVSLETEDGLSPNARKVQEFADTLAAEIEAEDIAAPEDSEDSSKNEEDDDI